MAITLDGTNGINSSGVIVAPDGSASAPAITNDGDTNTGIFFPAADTIAFAEGGAEAMRVDSSGNVGIGTTSPSTYGKFVTYSSGGYGAINSSGQILSYQLLDVATAGGRLTGGSSQGYLGDIGIEQTTTGAKGGYIRFNTAPSGTNTSTERMRIDSSGGLRVGTTTNIFNAASAERFTVKNTVTGSAATFESTDVTGGYPILYLRSTDASSSQNAVFFYRTNTLVGSITTTASTTAFNTSSDYRLKENITPMTGALATVAQLKPCTYTWKADGSASQGFIAHELQEVVPECVTGEKDAVNEDGSIKPQGIDTSFLVATLTAAIQELSAKNDALEARIAALEGAQA